MRHLTSFADAKPDKPSVVTIGVFDGVHRGHQHLIRQFVEFARNRELTSIALSFYPNPRLVIQGYEPGYYLTLPDSKAQLLGQLGVEIVITHPFDESVRHIRALDFLDSLFDRLAMRALWVGTNFAFGYKREGTVEWLQDQAGLRSFELNVVELYDSDSSSISSTLIRESLRRGDITVANELLGRRYRVPGTVVMGHQRGRVLGFPTANLAVNEDQAIPSNGVYATYALVNHQAIPSVTNIGVRPTFDGVPTRIIETHLLDFAGNLYDSALALDFVARLRDELRFPSVDALTAQIGLDIEHARQLLATSPSPR